MSSTSTLVILIRHAEREFQLNLTDDEQALTPHGRKQALSLSAKLAQSLEQHYQPPPGDKALVRIIFSSPAARCMQTANLVATQLYPHTGVQPARELLVGSDQVVKWTLSVVSANLGSGPLVFVGHKPELAEVSGRLYNGKKIDLKEAEAVAIELTTNAGGFWQAGSGKLLWRIKG